MSADTCHVVSSSGTFWNFANRDWVRKLPPSGESSMPVTVVPKVAAHASKSPIPACSSRVGAQVALHHVRLGDAVGDRGRGGEAADPPAGVTPAQVVQLHVQVGRAL
jgi:hypothetical protein